MRIEASKGQGHLLWVQGGLGGIPPASELQVINIKQWDSQDSPSSILFR